MKLFTLLFIAVSWATFAQQQQEMSLAVYEKANAVKTHRGFSKSLFRYQGLTFLASDAPLSFQLNDGLERKVTFFDILENPNAGTFGRLAVYSTPNRQVTVVIPTEQSPKAVKDKYAEDLKAKCLANDGLGVCVAFAFSQTNPVQTAIAFESQEFCFPAETFVNLVDGTEARISTIKIGDEITGLRANRVENIIVHEGTFSLTRLLVRSNSQAWVSTRNDSGLLSLEVTPNHPVLTLFGKKRVEELRKGDWLFVRDAVSGRYLTAELTGIAPHSRTVSKVYHLQTNSGTYEAENIVVLNKH